VVACTACGEDNPARARFCLGCGTALAGRTTAREVRKTVTVLFCDLVGSTELGERMDPEAMRMVLDRYFAVLQEQVQRHGGVVEKFIGDAVMAVFGIPLLNEDDALRAVRAAGDIPPAVEELNRELERRFAVRLQVRVGVDTGEVVAGTGPADGGQRLATGDAVNLAARLQGMAGPGEVLLAEATHRLVQGLVDADRLPAVAVKGKSEPVVPWRLRGPILRGAGARAAAPTTLRGRTGELAALQQAWSETLSGGTPRRRVVLGSAGVGKSRLLAEFLDRCRGATVLRGRCLSYGQGITFWPVREMLASAAQWSEEESAEEALRKLADLMPGRADASEIAERVGQLLGLTGDAGSLSEAFWALARLLEELAGWSPVIVAVDDLHWAEASLLDLLDHLAATVKAPLLVLGGARPELLDAHPQWSGGAGERLGLEPLTGEEAAGLLDDLLGVDAVPPGVAEHVLAAAEGNPLFVEQLVAMLLDEGALRRRDGGWELTRQLTPGLLPSSVATLLAARLERLAPAEQRELEAGSVVGRVFWRGAVAELAREVVGADAGAHLTALVGRRLIHTEPSSFPGDEAFKFDHVLIRDAAYRSMPKAERTKAHQRFADWLENAAGERATEYDEIVGYHLEQAVLLRREIGLSDEPDQELALRAGRLLAAAGLRSHGRGDIHTTIGLLTRAEQLLHGDPVAHVDTLTDLGHGLWISGKQAEARARFTAAVEKAAALGDECRELRARLALIDLDSWSDDAWDGSAALPSLHQTVTALEALGDDQGLADAWFLIGRIDFDAGHAGAAEAALQRAVLHGRRSKRSRASAQPAIWLLLALLTGPTPVEAASARLETIATEFGGDLHVQAQLLNTAALLAAMRRDFTRAWQLVGRARRLFEELGVYTGRAACSFIEYEIGLREGDVTAAADGLAAADEYLESIDEHGGRSTVLAMLAAVRLPQGQLDEAERVAALAREMTQPGDLYTDVVGRTAIARARSLRGDLDAADEVAREAVALASASDNLTFHGDALLVLADVHLRAGRSVEAAESATAARALYEQKGDLASLDRADALLRRLTPATSA
jgi:class 3 adenylate cyclase/tetratricopeptide (TPR) repeat protein